MQTTCPQTENLPKMGEYIFLLSTFSIRTDLHCADIAVIHFLQQKNDMFYVLIVENKWPPVTLKCIKYNNPNLSDQPSWRDLVCEDYQSRIYPLTLASAQLTFPKPQCTKSLSKKGTSTNTKWSNLIATWWADQWQYPILLAKKTESPWGSPKHTWHNFSFQTVSQ